MQLPGSVPGGGSSPGRGQQRELAGERGTMPGTYQSLSAAGCSEVQAACRPGAAVP